MLPLYYYSSTALVFAWHWFHAVTRMANVAMYGWWCWWRGIGGVTMTWLLTSSGSMSLGGCCIDCPACGSAFGANMTLTSALWGRL